MCLFCQVESCHAPRHVAPRPMWSQTKLVCEFAGAPPPPLGLRHCADLACDRAVPWLRRCADLACDRAVPWLRRCADLACDRAVPWLRRCADLACDRAVPWLRRCADLACDRAAPWLRRCADLTSDASVSCWGRCRRQPVSPRSWSRRSARRSGPSVSQYRRRRTASPPAGSPRLPPLSTVRPYIRHTVIHRALDSRYYKFGVLVCSFLYVFLRTPCFRLLLLTSNSSAIRSPPSRVGCSQCTT